jgi:hypothetical protein
MSVVARGVGVGVGIAVGGVSAVLLLAGSACSDGDGGGPDDLSQRRDLSLDDLGAALGCDAMRGASYENLRDRDATPPLPEIAEEGRDCYRDDRFVGRVHVFEDVDAAEALADQQVQEGRASHQPECYGDSLQVVAGDRWAVVTRGSATAEDVQERIGGQDVPIPSGSTSFVSYALPCVGAPEPD